MAWWHPLLDLLLADTCVLCKQTLRRRTAHLLCAFCWAALPRNVNACPHCAIPQPSAGTCGRCQLRPFTPDVCLAALRYHAEARTLVHQLKYAHDFRAGISLAHVMGQTVQRRYRADRLPALLIPVPLSYPRQLTRGYNQAAWLAHQLGRELNIPLFYGPLKRRPGTPQHTLPRKQRLGLSAASFALRAPLYTPHVAIIDDVMTTGATSAALVKLLKARGAERVDIWCATRAVLD
jgi:ComF family protein